MPDEPMIVQQAPKTWRDRGLDLIFNQGPTTIVLLIVAGCFGYYIYNEMPKRDSHWAKAYAEQSAEFKKILEERDVRNLAYRTAADAKHIEERKEIREDSEKQYKRLESLMLALQRHGVALEKKLDAAMP